MDYLTTDQAGKILGVTGRRVKVWMINKKDLKKVAVRKPGRPSAKGGRYGKS
jgi:hypothetical protein